MLSMAARLVSKLNRLLKSRGGNFAISFAILMVPIISAAGLAVDYTQVTQQRSQLREALDGAVLAALSPETMSDADRITLAEKYFLSNAQNPCTTKPIVTIANTKDRVDASAGCAVEMAFVSVIGIKTVPINAVAAAKKSVSAGGMPMCVLALDPAMSKSIESSGGTQWVANECLVQNNSNNAKSVNLSGNSSITSGENCFVGGVDQGLSLVKPAPTKDCKAVPDPFASIAKPPVGSCDYTKYSADTDTTLYPGVYCQGLTLKNNTFTFKPGLYIIKDGTFASSGGATFNGTGVTFFLTGSNIGLNWSGGGSYHFSAMKTGALAGFVVYLDPNGTPNAKTVISGGGGTYYEGVLYFPGQKVEISGTGTVASVSPFTAFVAKNFLFSGGSKLLVNIDPAKTDVPIPPGLYKAAAKSSAPYLLY